MELWIVGEVFIEENENWNWGFTGVFETEEKAVAACITSAHFIGPANLNERLPDEEEWEGAYYPLAKDKFPH